MITDEERKYLVELLSSLKEGDVIALASTSTSGKLSPKDKQDAIECILLHSESAETILKRKKITKDFLFNYLHAKKVNVLVSDEKPRLIQLILQLWSGVSLPSPQYPSQNALNSFGSHTVNDSTSVTLVRNNILLNVTPRNIETCGLNLGMSSHLFQNSTSSITSQTVSMNQKVVEFDDSTIDTLAFKFSEWFYTLLNKNFKGGLIALNSEHFWNDAEFILRLRSSSSFSSTGVVNVGNNLLEEERVNGVDDIIILLNKVKDRYQIYFSPNLCRDGVKGKLDVHGGVLVLACGTLHKDIGRMCGAFEQVFLIFRDPLTTDNWKIKKTELHLISVDHNSICTSPTLNDTTLKRCFM